MQQQLRIDENTALVDDMNAREILESYEEITVGEQLLDDVLFFNLFEKTFLLFSPDKSDPSSMAAVYLYNDELLDFPHIMLREERIAEGKEMPSGTYRYVCLFEQESIVNTLVPYEDKIIDCIDRLIELLSMNSSEQTREFQKEFMFYWNSESKSNRKYVAYIEHETQFTEMDAFYGENKVRLIERCISLSDIDDRNKAERKWVHHIENEVFYIPITDSRGILPPHKGFSWSADCVKNIVFGKRIEHIDDDTYSQIKTIIPKTQDLILVFGMKTEQSNVTFALKVRCNNHKGHTLLNKLLSDITAVEPLSTERKDYLFLCEQIGNDIGLMHKRVLLIGAGSLGSYVAFEMVKNGIQRLKIYDNDKLVEENILRWAFGGFGIGLNKAATLQFLLNMLHPEIKVEACAEKITEKSLTNEISNTDIIIFTIGSSDEQLKLNAALKRAHCSIPVIFVWLEEGGEYSHILVANYQKPGCFECLYTNDQGAYVNNRARKNTEIASEKGVIRNGCGGTRAAYGTAILLRTTAALLDVIRNIQGEKITKNTLIDISSDRIDISDTVFPMEACNCCGNSVQ